MKNIDTSSSLISLSIPTSTTSFYSTGRCYIARLTKCLLIYFTDTYLSSSVIQIPTTSTVCTCPSKLKSSMLVYNYIPIIANKEQQMSYLASNL